MFFFEKKNQKTFSFWVALCAGGMAVAPTIALATGASTPREAVSATLEKNDTAVRIVFKGGKSLLVPMRDDDAVGFDAPTISTDRRTVAWTENLQVAANHADAAFAYVYRDGRQVQMLGRDGKPVYIGGCPNGGATSDWHILAGGRQLYEACAFPHGEPFEYRSLYDLDTGKLLGSVAIDNDTGEPPTNAPAWAKHKPPQQ